MSGCLSAHVYICQHGLKRGESYDDCPGFEPDQRVFNRRMCRFLECSSYLGTELRACTNPYCQDDADGGRAKVIEDGKCEGHGDQGYQVWREQTMVEDRHMKKVHLYEEGKDRDYFDKRKRIIARRAEANKGEIIF